MGCVVAKEKKLLTITTLTEFEESLGFSKYSSESIEKAFYQHSKEHRLTQEGVTRSLSSLKMDPEELLEFFSLFKNQIALKYEIVVYDAQKLATFGILFGNAEESVKLKLLFRNYDYQVKKYLDSSEVKVFVQDIIEICVVIIPSYGKKIINTQKCSDYAKILSKSAKASEEFFVQLLLLGEEKILEENFFTAFEQPEINCLIKPQKLREACFNLFENLYGLPKDSTIKKMNSNSTADS